MQSIENHIHSLKTFKHIQVQCQKYAAHITCIIHVNVVGLWTGCNGGLADNWTFEHVLHTFKTSYVF